MIKWNNFTSGKDRFTNQCTPLARSFLIKKRPGINKYIVASALIIGSGACFAGQAFARDTTPPVIKATVNGTLGTNGWYTSNVSVTWTVTDTGSSITSKSGCGNVTLTTDTSGVTYTCQATSRGGTASQSVTIKRDTTPPKATIIAPASAPCG